MFRNKIQELLKVEDLLTPSDFPETEECPQKFENLVSAYNQVTDSTCGCLSLHSRSRSCLSDSPALNTSDTLILALELFLKVATRPPPFRVRFCQDQSPAGVPQGPGACRPTASTNSSSDDETLDLSGLHHPTQDFSDDALLWDDLLPAPCVSGDTWSLSDNNLWSSDSEEVIVGPPSEAGDLIPEIMLAHQLNWDFGVDKEDNGFASRNVSSPLVSETV